MNMVIHYISLLYCVAEYIMLSIKMGVFVLFHQTLDYVLVYF